jgi:predicted NAD/FAD-binding protein
MAAYFLHEDCNVEVFESRHKIGGHCDSITFDYQGYPLTVDLGAQFFHPDTHPLYVTLLEEIALFDPEHRDQDETLEAPGGICVFPTGSSWPLLSSTLPFFTLYHAANFAIYAQLARQAILSNMSWDITVESWIAGLPVAGSFKRDVLFPWISALIGTDYEHARGASARSILQTFALAFPENLLSGATTYNSNIGLGGNLERLLQHSPGVQVHLESAIQNVRHESGQWFVETGSESHGPFDSIIVNAPPHASQGFLSSLSWAAETVQILQRFEYFDARLVIHTDPTYMHSWRPFWSAYNAAVGSTSCEGSVWYGALHGNLPNGRSIDVFKSWAHFRRDEPRNKLFERSFRHPHITPNVIEAARDLSGKQGQNGLYFCGQHTTGMDLQEACVYSAMNVADALAPTSASLASLRSRLAVRGRTGINYDL